MYGYVFILFVDIKWNLKLLKYYVSRMIDIHPHYSVGNNEFHWLSLNLSEKIFFIRAIFRM